MKYQGKLYTCTTEERCSRKKNSDTIILITLVSAFRNSA